MPITRPYGSLKNDGTGWTWAIVVCWLDKSDLIFNFFIALTAKRRVIEISWKRRNAVDVVRLLWRNKLWRNWNIIITKKHISALQRQNCSDASQVDTLSHKAKNEDMSYTWQCQLESTRDKIAKKSNSSSFYIGFQQCKQLWTTHWIQNIYNSKDLAIKSGENVAWTSVADRHRCCTAKQSETRLSATENINKPNSESWTRVNFSLIAGLKSPWACNQELQLLRGHVCFGRQKTKNHCDLLKAFGVSQFAHRNHHHPVHVTYVLLCNSPKLVSIRESKRNDFSSVSHNN